MDVAGGHAAVTEVVEAEGHLIDSQLMNAMFDTVVRHDAAFDVLEFRIGRTNDEPSFVSMRVTAKGPAALTDVLEELVALGCRVARAEDAHLVRRRSRRLRARGLLLDDQPPDATCRIGGQWVAGRAPAHGRRHRHRGGRAPSAASCATSAGRRHRLRHSRREDRPRIPGARPPRLRVHDQRDLVRAAGRGRRRAHRGDDARGQGRPATASPSSPDRSSCTPAAARTSAI